MKLIKKIYNSFYSRSTILAFLLLVIITSILFQDKNFLTTANVFNILLKAAKNGGFLALGMTFVILCAEIDLSVGAVFALSGVVMGLTAQVNPVFGIVCGLLVGIVSGLMIGLMVTKMRISSWIASLAMLFMTRGSDSDYCEEIGGGDRECSDLRRNKGFKGRDTRNEQRNFDSDTSPVSCHIYLYVYIEAYEIWNGDVRGGRKRRGRPDDGN